MPEAWIEQETDAVDFGDARLDRRLIRILTALGSQPQASVPAATGNRNDMEAAYEFFANPRVTPGQILAGHMEATHGRIDEQAVAILVQDTTEAERTRPNSIVAGAGPLDGATRRGGLLHPLIAFTADGTPLGTVACPWWTREEPPETKPSRSQRAATPIEQKERLRWVTMLQEAHAVAARHPATRIVCVADSESDIDEVLAEGTRESGKARWVVRACQDRALRPSATENAPDREGESVAAGDSLRARLAAQPVRFDQTLDVRAREPKVAVDLRKRRQSREARTARLAVRATNATVRAPWRPGERLPDVTVNAVLVSEVGTHETPVE
jgi:hypothetical protein